MKRCAFYISLMAIFVLIATPVLGCCGMGHVGMTHEQPLEAAAMSCHGPTDVVTADKKAPNAPCPSCDNCVDQVVERVDAGALTFDASSHPVAIVAAQGVTTPKTDWRLPPITGPPPHVDSMPVDSPAAQNDRLLI